MNWELSLYENYINEVSLTKVNNETINDALNRIVRIFLIDFPCTHIH